MPEFLPEVVPTIVDALGIVVAFALVFAGSLRHNPVPCVAKEGPCA